MAMAAEQQQLPPALRCESPSPDLAPTRAIGPVPELSRCLSTASDMSHGSGTDFTPRDSLGRSSSDGFSRHSSASYGRRSDVSFASSRQSTCSLLTDRDGARVASRRRGYMRPQGTTFAASAQSRESVLSLGSIAHLQYYFARTGLLDGKGAQLQRKNKHNRSTLDLSALDDPSAAAGAGASMLSPTMLASDADSSYASMGSSPDLGASSTFAGPLVGSPIDVDDYDDGPYDSDDYDAPDPDMLPPTASTYIHREKPLARPPTIEELKSELTTSLQNASNALEDARNATAQQADDAGPGTPSPRRGSAAATTESPRPRSSHHLRHQSKSQGWFEIQGMHILDVMTLAIRAAKMYYTAHEHPERLDAIKPERQVRSELFAVMETLKQMATRRWAGGMRPDEIESLDAWLRSLFAMLSEEAVLERRERAEREGWTWLSGDWAGREIDRELSFLASLEAGLAFDPLPEYTPARGVGDVLGPGGETPFLRAFTNGLRLVKLHNAAVRRSKRRFGGITTFHEDTEKPYRCADNLRYWVKAAELRWETHLRIDPLGIVYNTTPTVWADFEDAIFKWCRKVREEISADIVGDTAA